MTSTPTPHSLHNLYMPFPRKDNAHAKAAWQKTVEWVEKYHLIRDEKQLEYFRSNLDYYLLSAWAFPNADEDKLALVNDWMTLFYFFDKMWDDASPLGLRFRQSGIRLALELRGYLLNWKRWLKQQHWTFLATKVGWKSFHYGRSVSRYVLRREESSLADSLIDAMDNVRTRTENHGSPEWRAHFARSMSAYFDACVWEAINKSKKMVPSPEEYIKKRRDTGAVQPSFELAGVLGLLDKGMAPESLDHPRVRKLSEVANDVITLFNDLISLEKEKRDGDIHNLVFIIMTHEKCDEREAFARISKLHDEKVREFEQLSKAFETQVLHASGPVEGWDRKNNAGALEYLDVLRCWMRSNMDWSLMSERYNYKAAA